MGWEAVRAVEVFVDPSVSNGLAGSFAATVIQCESNQDKDRKDQNQPRHRSATPPAARQPMMTWPNVCSVHLFKERGSNVFPISSPLNCNKLGCGVNGPLGSSSQSSNGHLQQMLHKRKTQRKTLCLHLCWSYLQCVLGTNTNRTVVSFLGHHVYIMFFVAFLRFAS